MLDVCLASYNYIINTEISLLITSHDSRLALKDDPCIGRGVGDCHLWLAICYWVTTFNGDPSPQPGGRTRHFLLYYLVLLT